MITRAPNVDCHVKILTGQDRGHVVRLGAPSLLIGRDSDCDLVLASSFVSRRHALLERRGDGDYLADLKSANGTKVNGRHLRGERRLDDGDVIHIYQFALLYRCGPPDPTERGGNCSFVGTVHERRVRSPGPTSALS